jgi:hypothetical protein
VNTAASAVSTSTCNPNPNPNPTLTLTLSRGCGAESTPRPPVAAAALALSPFLWGLNRPDLFDTYSVGIILLQLSVPNLRQKSGMAATGLFQRNLLNADYDLQVTRRELAGCRLELAG